MNIKTIDEKAVSENDSGVLKDVKHWNIDVWSSCNSVNGNEKVVDGIWNIPSSMFFCDPQIKFSVLPRVRIELYLAIRARKVFQIFLHLYDLLAYPSLKDDLDRFLELWQRRGVRGRLKLWGSLQKD